MSPSARLATTVGAVCVLVLVAVVLLGGGGSGDRPPATATLPTPPSPVIGQPPAPEPSLAAARAAAQRFLGPYLRYVYGRARAQAVHDVTPAVAHELRRGRARPTPAQAQRRPRLAGLDVTLQTPTSAIATATVADGGPVPYRIVVGLERRGGRWLVSDLGND